ncbi:MAG TPA: flagellar motor switch protein FliN [Stellaceae bacterium]|jgi:flagellar motor switch protein FliN/FliY|nr:flagellar motor switch protein FliN [Stellaceae bacterium]
MAADLPLPEAVDTAATPAGAEASPFAALEPQPESARAPAVNGDADGAAAGRLELVFDVPVCLSVELGRTEVPIRDVVNLGRGSIIELDRGPGTPLDVRVNGVLIGRGEVVLVNAERLGLRFVEVVSQAERVKRLG